MDSRSDQLIPTRPYLIRAIREWALENGLTPQLMVDGEVDDVVIPEGYSEDGKILLNVHTRAVSALELGNEVISFSARFGGMSCSVRLPVPSILAVFSQENGQGYFFRKESESQIELETNSSQGSDSADPRKKSDRPNLYVVE